MRLLLRSLLHIVIISAGGIGCAPLPAALDPIVAGEAVSAVFEDGEFSCEEHEARNMYNMCPAERPTEGVDDDGIEWRADLVFGLFPNPFHAPLDCFRGTSSALGVSGFQCCYEGEDLIDMGPLAGTFDFFTPAVSVINHFFFDVLSDQRCAE